VKAAVQQVLALRVSDDVGDYTTNKREAKTRETLLFCKFFWLYAPLWRLQASPILLKLHVQHLSIADDLYLRDTGQPKQPGRDGGNLKKAV